MGGVTSVKQPTLSGFDYRSHLIGSWNRFGCYPPETGEGHPTRLTHRRRVLGCEGKGGAMMWPLQRSEMITCKFSQNASCQKQIDGDGHVYVNLQTFLR